MRRWYLYSPNTLLTRREEFPPTSPPQITPDASPHTEALLEHSVMIFPNRAGFGFYLILITAGTNEGFCGLKPLRKDHSGPRNT